MARETEPLTSRYFVVANLFGVASLMPAILVLYGLFPDWSLMYLANPSHLSGFLIVPVLVLAAAGGPALGFLAIFHALRQSKTWRRRGPWVVLWALAGVILLFGGGRILTVAYYDAFHTAGARLGLFQSALFLPLMLCAGAVVSVYVYVVMHVKRHIEMGRGLPTDR